VHRLSRRGFVSRWAYGSASRSVPYWDAVAALNTPTESYSPSAAARRDEFLSAAIAQLIPSSSMVP
jgi:hypothetical protein